MPEHRLPVLGLCLRPQWMQPSLLFSISLLSLLVNKSLNTNQLSPFRASYVSLSRSYKSSSCSRLSPLRTVSRTYGHYDCTPPSFVSHRGILIRGFVCCLQSPTRSRWRLPVGLGSSNIIPVLFLQTNVLSLLRSIVTILQEVAMSTTPVMPFTPSYKRSSFRLPFE